MEADSTSDKMPKDPSDMVDQSASLCEDRLHPQMHRVQPVCKDSYVESSVSCSTSSTLDNLAYNKDNCHTADSEDSTANIHVDDKPSKCLSSASLRTEPMEDSKVVQGSSTSLSCLADDKNRCLIDDPGSQDIASSQPSLETGFKESQSDTDNCSKSDLTPDTQVDAKKHSSGLEKQSGQGEDLYSEIIATTTKVKILKKYFGDSRRPGLCHRPHAKRNYGSFKCRECYLSFNYLPSLLFHRNAHSKKYHVYECSKCSYKSSIPGAYTQHELSQHSDQLYQCHACSITFLQKSTLKRHKAASHCNQQATDHVQNQSVSFVCNLCNGMFYSKIGVTNHLKVQHMILNTDFLDKCTDTRGAESGSLTATNSCEKQEYYHVITRRKARPNDKLKGTDEVMCKKCKQLFPSKGMYFIQHRRAVDKSVAWAKTSCQWCGFIGVSTCQLAHHKRRVHFCCLLCNQKHPNKALLKQHKKRFHSGIAKQGKAVKGTTLTSHCKDQSNQTLHNHDQQSGSKCTTDKHVQHTDDVCDKNDSQQPVAAASSEVVQHWYCMTCNVIFPTKRLLDLHIKLNHRPMKQVESSQEVTLQQPDDDREWRCLLCNTLHQTLQECDKHQILHHPDEYEYCSRAEIAEPTLPLVMSALSEAGPPYTCSMCDCKISSIGELHKHKQQFHKVAYSISITDELHAKKRVYRCRYRCGYTDSIYKNVNKHEPSCKTPRKPNLISQPPIVLDTSSGQMLTSQLMTANSDECHQQSSEQKEIKALSDHEEVQVAASDSPDVDTKASSDKHQDVEPSVNKLPTTVVVKPLDSTCQPPKPKPQQTVQSAPKVEPISQQSCQLQPHLQTMKPGSSASTEFLPSGKVGIMDVKKKSNQCLPKGVQQSHKLPVYGKYDVISSSSDDDSDCSWLDKSSESEDSPTADSPGMDSVSSEEELVKEEEHVKEETAQKASSSAPQNQVVGQNIQGKSVASAPKTCPPLLQPTVLMRFFQAIDMSDLYRLALQMITGSPQPHTLPMSDPAMTTFKTANFKYKIPLGYSHKEFQDMPLFPSSREVIKLDYMQTLPLSLISRYYKGVLAKPFHRHLSSLVDSAMINNFKENTLKGIERFVRKQRIDDRKDITLSLSKYIVSQYFKNQQKKSPSKQFQSSFGVNLTGNSPGAGPSGTQAQPIRLLISPTALQGASRPLTTVKGAALVSDIRRTSIQANIGSRLPVAEKLVNVTNQDVSKSRNVDVCTTAVHTSKTSLGTSSNSAGVEKKSPSPDGKTGQKTASNSNNGKKSLWSRKVNKKKNQVESLPVRRSARLLRSSEKQESGATESTNGFTLATGSDIKIVGGKSACVHVQENNKQEFAGKSKAQEKARHGSNHDADGDCESSETTNEVNEQHKSKQKAKPVKTGRCRNIQSKNLDDNRSDQNPPKVKPPSSHIVSQTKSWSADTSTLEQTNSSKTYLAQHAHKCASGVADEKHSQMLYMVQDICLDSKLKHDSMVANTIERDGVLETRMTRRPLHGLNGSTMQRHSSINTDTYCIIRQAAPLNGKTCRIQTTSMNIEKMKVADGSLQLANVPIKANDDEDKPESITGAVDDPILQPDLHIKHARHVSLECDGILNNEMTYSNRSSQPCKEQLPPMCNLLTCTLNATKNTSTGKTWKKTINKYEVLALMTKRKKWKCAPYKTVPSMDASQEENTQVQVKMQDIEREQRYANNLITREKDQDLPLECKNDSTENECIESGNDMTTFGNLAKSCESKLKRRAPTKPESGPEKKPCVINSDCMEEAMHCGIETFTEAGITPTPEQADTQSPDSATETDGNQSKTTPRQGAEVVQTLASTGCDTDLLTCAPNQTSQSYLQVNNSNVTFETSITRRSLRNKEIKKRADVSIETRRDKKKASVDHSYIKTLRSKSNNRIKKMRVGVQHVKPPRSVTCLKTATRSKMMVDKLTVPHDHSYTGNKQHKGSKGTGKMDHCYYWKIPNDLSKIPHEPEGCKPCPKQRSTNMANVGKSRQARGKDKRGCAEDQSRCHDHSYSTSFPKQVQDQIAAMDHCYVKLTPINIAHKQNQDQESTDKNKCSEKKRRKVDPYVSSTGHEKNSCQLMSDQSCASLRRQLRPRNLDSSHSATKRVSDVEY